MKRNLSLCLAESSRKFTIEVKTDNPGETSDTSFKLGLKPGELYDGCVVEWGNGITQVLDSDVSPVHDYGVAGVFDISIMGDFPAIFFADTGDKEKMRDVKRWGNSLWKTFQAAFCGCSNMIITATDKPKTQNVQNYNSAFLGVVNMGIIVPFDMSSMNDGVDTFKDVTLDTGSYSDLLHNLERDNSLSGKTLNGGLSKRNAKGTAAHVKLLARGWTVPDGGVE